VRLKRRLRYSQVLVPAQRWRGRLRQIPVFNGFIQVGSCTICGSTRKTTFTPSGANFYASNKCAGEILFRVLVGVRDPVFDAGSEVLQACDDQTQLSAGIAGPSLAIGLGGRAVVPDKAGGGCYDSRTDPTHEPSQRFVESAPHSRRTAQTSDRRSSIDLRQISTPEPQAAFAELATILEKSHEADGVDGLLYRADCFVLSALRLRRSLP